MTRPRMRQLLTWLTAGVVITAALASAAWAGDQENVVYTFTGDTNRWPSGDLLFDASGNLYGTTYAGQVFELVPSGGTWTYNALYDFGTGGEDNTWGVTFDKAGDLYGTTYNDGSSDYGIVFELLPTGNGTWKKKVIRAFNGATGGGHPYGNVIFDDAGNLYGTAVVGNHSVGIVFKLIPRKRGQWKESILHVFGSQQPNPALAFDSSGHLYDTTFSGGAHGAGSVFKLSSVKGKWSEKVLYDFTGGGDGSNPNAGVFFAAAGNLFGTTAYGGADGGGVVFELTSSQKGGWTESVIENFHYHPFSLIADASGNLYGTAGELVFELQHLKDGQWREVVLYRFTGGDAHAGPQGLVFDSAGNLYGATLAGGVYGSGTIYELTP